MGEAKQKRLRAERLRQAGLSKAFGNGWIGYTEGRGTAATIAGGEGETAEFYLHRARFLIAGVTAERLFDPDFRPGSSLDEVVMARVMGIKAAHLAGAGADEDRFYRTEVLETVRQVLTQHKESAREIARHLFDHHSADGARLATWCKQIRDQQEATA
jgi:hypothetical protein